MFCSWDELLDGGLYSGEVTEIVGTAGSGKTQVRFAVWYKNVVIIQRRQINEGVPDSARTT